MRKLLLPTTLLLLVSLVNLVPLALALQDYEPPSINKVDVGPPNIITPFDRPYIRVNVTAPRGISEVWLYFRLSSIELRFNSTLEYDVRAMIPTYGSPTNGFWEYQFDNQTAGTRIYFFLVAEDRIGQNTTSRDFLAPYEVIVTQPPKSRVSFIRLVLNDILLNYAYTAVDITIGVQAYLPNPKENWLNLRVIDYKGYRVGTALDIFEREPRFYYVGEGGGRANIDGDLGAYPYDSYLLTLWIVFPCHVEDLDTLRPSNYKIPIELAEKLRFGFTDAWNITWVSQDAWHAGDETVVHLVYSFARRVPLIYPPLAVLAVGFLVLGFTPLVTRMYSRKRLDIFFTVVVLAATVLLSERINPFGFANTFIESLYAFLLIATAAMIGLTLVAPITRRIPRLDLPVESVACLGLAVVAFFLVWPSGLPLPFRLFAPVLFLPGTIVRLLVDRKDRRAREIRDSEFFL